MLAGADSQVVKGRGVEICEEQGPHFSFGILFVELRGEHVAA